MFIFITVQDDFYLIGCYFYICIIIYLGRVLRLQASSADTTLTLKRNFVRYISHELRSPLNVVYSGIEYLRSKLVELSGSAEVLELVDEVFVANENAISILDNLLNYESIDAGQFTLEFAWKPLHQFLGDCLKIQPYL